MRSQLTLEVRMSATGTHLTSPILEKSAPWPALKPVSDVAWMLVVVAIAPHDLMFQPESPT